MVGISIVLLFRIHHSVISFIIVIMWVYGRTSTICMNGRCIPNGYFMFLSYPVCLIVSHS